METMSIFGESVVSKTSMIEYGGNTYIVDFENEQAREELKRDLNSRFPDYNWRWFKEERGKKNWVLYRGDMFYEKTSREGGKSVTFLKYINSSGAPELPINCSSCYDMFSVYNLTEDVIFGDKFNTKDVVDMRNMFHMCGFPNNFSLGDKFDTSNVTDMYRMFAWSNLPTGFSLGDKFDTSNVTNMSSMFSHADFPTGFSLGDKFDTSNVTNMYEMFSHADFPAGFSLGDKFDTSNVTDMYRMFSNADFSAGFSLGDKFSTVSVADTSSMFSECISLPKDFPLNRKAASEDIIAAL